MDEVLVKKKKKRVLRCPLFMGMTLSVLVVLLLGVCLVNWGPFISDIRWDRPAFVAIVLGEKHPTREELELQRIEEEKIEQERVLRELEKEAYEAAKKKELEAELEQEREREEAEEAQKEKQESLERIEARYIEDYGVIPEYNSANELLRVIPWNDSPARSYYYTNPGVRAVSTPYDFKTVEADYFKNSLFIGDSRMQGLHDYSGWEDVDFCYRVGLNVYTLFSKQVKTGEGSAMVEDILTSRPYENVYIMLGINELGMGLVDDFKEKYKENIDVIRSYQPDAKIIIMSIMFESKEYSDMEPYDNNDNINARNLALAELANGEDIFYLDVNPAVQDEDGMNLMTGITFDGVHLAAKNYYLWTEYMLKHAY